MTLGRSGATLRLHDDSLCGRLRFGMPYDFDQETGQMNGLQIEPQFAGFDAGQIEKLMDRFGQLFDPDE